MGRENGYPELRGKGQRRAHGEHALLREMETRDPVLRALEKERERIDAQQRDNSDALENGAYEQAGYYDLLGMLPDAREYPVYPARRGGIVAPRGEDFAFLFSPNEYSGRGPVTLTENQIRATSFWDSLPRITFPPSVTAKGRQARHEPAIALGQLVDDVSRKAALRLLSIATRQRIVALREQISGQSVDEAMHDLSMFPAHGMHEPLIHWKAAVEEYDEPASLAERLVATVLTRVSDHTPTPLFVRGTSARADLTEGVDLYVRVGSLNDPDAYICAIDVTTTRDKNVLEKKHLEASTANPNALLRDPLGTGRRLPVGYAIVDAPHINSTTALSDWRRARGNTAITPEFFLRFDHRRELVHRSLIRLHGPDGAYGFHGYRETMPPYFSVYGPYEDQHKIPRNASHTYR